MKKDKKNKEQPVGRSEPKIKRGRPVENELPESIPDTPENVARACMQGPPKKEWRYTKKGKYIKKRADSPAYTSAEIIEGR